MKFKSQMQLDTMVEDMEMAQNICNRELNEFFLNVGIFKKILVTEASNKNVTKYREDSGKDALILKPMPHVALFKAIHFLKENTDMDIDAIYRAANKIDFSYEKGSNNQWLKWVISDAGTITTSGKVEGVLTRMLVYFIAGKARCEKFENGQEWLNELFENYKELAGDVSELPEPKFK